MGIPKHLRFDALAELYDGRARPFYRLKAVSRILDIPYTTLMDEVRAGRLTYRASEGQRRGYEVRGEWVDEWIERGTRLAH